MNLDWLLPNTIYLTLHGSQAYGTANDLSDVDTKGICIPPRSIQYNLFQRFEQAENQPFVEEAYVHLKNPKNPKFESTIFSLRKFIMLATNINPNIIELLWSDPKDIFLVKPPMDMLLDRRALFLSSKAKFTFSGYAISQLKRINRHRKWIVQGEVPEPKRTDFGLPAVPPKHLDEIFGHIKSEVEKWNLNQFALDEMDRNELKETLWELLRELTDKDVSWDNWPDAYAAGVMHKMGLEWNLKEEVVDMIYRERAYAKAMTNYKDWLRWKAERNPARRALEVKCGYDSKHASHLVRLMRMGHEILTFGQVIVKRPDSDELLFIKNGGWTYEQVVEYAETMQRVLDEAYKTTKLPKFVDQTQINDLYQKMEQKYYHDAQNEN